MKWKVDREFGMKDDWEEKKMGNEVSKFLLSSQLVVGFKNSDSSASFLQEFE